MDRDFPLIWKMKNGSEEAVESFVRRYYPVILKYCRYHIPDYSYAEDLTQETFERFFKTFENYRHYGKACNYLYVIAGNLCRDYYGKRREITMQEFPETGENPIDEANDRMDIEKAMLQLPDELREVLILFYFQELKGREIAEILKIGLPLVKYRLKRAKEQLSRLLGKEDNV